MSDDDIYMQRAIDVARHAELQSVCPNPRVGAVLVHEGRVIGEGCHRRVGEGHAEVNCLASVRPEDEPLIPDSTLYVTLEPCSHQGRTPSCARMLLSKGVRRVVVGCLDPNPLVSGRGVSLLKAGGVEVEVGCLEQECRDLARIFLANQELGRPYIILKWAESADGFIDRRRTDADTPPVLLSTPHTRMLVHRLRSACSGIVVGRRTLELDRPSLTNRYWPLSPYSPKRFVLTGDDLFLDEGWEQLRDVSPESMSYLLLENVTSLLVEGGAATLRSFLEADLWDEIRREVAPERTLVDGIAAPDVRDFTLVSIDRRDGHLLYRYKRRDE
jgi:diaminohydroxyphosphoribosylaminopyrimidine deaminase/5-amino-6-(5-phosphoribosylamino)uracil reductase